MRNQSTAPSRDEQGAHQPEKAGNEKVLGHSQNFRFRGKNDNPAAKIFCFSAASTLPFHDGPAAGASFHVHGLACGRGRCAGDRAQQGRPDRARHPARAALRRGVRSAAIDRLRPAAAHHRRHLRRAGLPARGLVADVLAAFAAGAGWRRAWLPAHGRHPGIGLWAGYRLGDSRADRAALPARGDGREARPRLPIARFRGS